jgi:hypothetical protein
MPQYLARRVKTEKHKITVSGTAKSTVPTTTQRKARGAGRRAFAGMVAYNDAASDRAFTVIISITDGTTSYTLDKTLVLIGESAVWMEDEYGVELGDDEYVSVTVSTADIAAIGSNDVIHLFIRMRDV